MLLLRTLLLHQISQPILLPDELSEILANLSVSPDTALRHIDALMGAEFTDMPVHEGEKGGLCLDAALQGLLDILSLEVRSLFHKHIECLLDGIMVMEVSSEVLSKRLTKMKASPC